MRYFDFQLGWFAHPILKGDYPQTMKDLVGERLPKFETSELNLIKGSIDFLGINHYTSTYVKNGKTNGTGWNSDKNTTDLVVKNGIPLGPLAQSKWLYVYPTGIRKLLNEINNTYGNEIEIWVTENGVDVPGENNLTDIYHIREDYFRLSYLKSYITELHKAIFIDKLNIKAYFVWSLLDNFEWAEGYESRFGLYHVDFKDQKRTLKFSGDWYRSYVVKCKTKFTSFEVVLISLVASTFILAMIGLAIYLVFSKKAEENTYERV